MADTLFPKDGKSLKYISVWFIFVGMSNFEGTVKLIWIIWKCIWTLNLWSCLEWRWWVWVFGLLGWSIIISNWDHGPSQLVEECQTCLKAHRNLIWVLEKHFFSFVSSQALSADSFSKGTKIVAQDRRPNWKDCSWRNPQNPGKEGMRRIITVLCHLVKQSFSSLPQCHI